MFNLEIMIETLDKLISIDSSTWTEWEKQAHKFIVDKVTWICSSKNKSWVKIKYYQNQQEVWVGDFRWYIVVDICAWGYLDTIALTGHYDVVPVSDNWSTPPFELHERDEKLYGRWSCDMKAGLAIMIGVLKESIDRKPTKNIKLIFTSAEETWQPNGLTLAISDWHLEGVDFAVALEPTNGEINTWVFWYLDTEFLYNGVPCHSSDPEKWENAIYKTWPLIKKLSEFPQDPSLVGSVEYNKRVLREALSITMVSWGQASNIIPDRSSIQTNYRYSPQRNWEDVEKVFRKLAGDVWAESIRIIEHNPSSRILEIDNVHLQRFMGLIGKKVKDLTVVPFWSDMSQTSRAWIPSVNFWPWSIEQAHKDDEFISKKDLEQGGALFMNYLF